MLLVLFLISVAVIERILRQDETPPAEEAPPAIDAEVHRLQSPAEAAAEFLDPSCAATTEGLLALAEAVPRQAIEPGGKKTPATQSIIEENAGVE